MRCFGCGDNMRVVALEPHETITTEGFGYKVWECPTCLEREKRPFFGRETGRPSGLRPVSDHIAQTPQQPTDVAALAFMKQFLAKLRHL